MAKVFTGLHRRPNFEELVLREDPTIHGPVRSAWEIRNSPFMSQFDAEWMHGTAGLGLLDDIREEQDQHAQNRMMEELFRQAGVPYRAQGPGGPPPHIPATLGGITQNAGSHQEAAQDHMSQQAIDAVWGAMSHVLNAQAVTAEVAAELPEQEEVERQRLPETMVRNFKTARNITHNVLHPTMGILGAAAGVSFEATATILGAMGTAVGAWAESEIEDLVGANYAAQPSEEDRDPETAHQSFLRRLLTRRGDVHDLRKLPPPGPPDSGGASGSGGPA